MSQSVDAGGVRTEDCCSVCCDQYNLVFRADVTVAPALLDWSTVEHQSGAGVWSYNSDSLQTTDIVGNI